MRRLRTASTRRLVTLVAVLVAAVAGAGIAQAALTNAPKPAPKPLDRAVYDALTAKPVPGVTARIKFTNKLLPSGALPQDTASPVLTGATGRLWLTADGRVRLELQSDAGDAQVVADGKRFMVYDAASHTAYTGDLPQGKTPQRPEKQPTLAGVQRGLAQLGQAWTLSGARPTTTAGQPSYTVRIAPKDDGGLLGGAEVTWDAVRAVPLRAAVSAQGAAEPVLELEATDIAYGKIAPSQISTTPPAGAKVTEINPPSGVDAHGRPAHVQGVDAVQKAIDFPLAAPAKLAGLPRRGVQLVSFGGEKGALVTYGQGLGAIAVFQHRGTESAPAGLTLPRINIDGATGSEVPTALGTVLFFTDGGISYVVAGSVSPASAEAAARGRK